MKTSSWVRIFGCIVGGIASLTSGPLRADTSVILTEVPDYSWYAGCFGTASGNLMGYWDRHGLANFYTGPTAGGIAPLNSGAANAGIRSMWASKAGVDGRPANQPGHIDDYWAYYSGDSNYSYESALPDAYLTAGRPEHAPDCIGDFIGLSQKKWTNLNNECAGNIDAYSFVFWDAAGRKRTNYTHVSADAAIPDIQSGLRAWTKYRGYDAEVVTQLTDFNPNVPAGQGFSFADLKREIDSGYPVLLFMQPFNQFSRAFGAMTNVNPAIHGMLAYGYDIPDSGPPYVVYRTSWGSGPCVVSPWTSSDWQAGLPVRGVICYRPKPKVTQVARGTGTVTIQWHGPTAQLYTTTECGVSGGTTTPVHRYVLERSATLDPADFQPVGAETTGLSLTVDEASETMGFFRVRLVTP